MHRILVLLTGGTIGSSSVNGTVDVDYAAAMDIEKLYYSEYGMDVRLEFRQVVNVLSENITSEIWLRLCDCLDNTDCTRYDGIIICHGSDTLAYTSCLIAFLYNHLPVPIVLTASNYELGNEKSNGLKNFRNAICLIKSGIRGIFVSYCDNALNNNIYIASRIVEADPFTDEFRSPDGKVWGRIINDRPVIYTSPGAEELNSFHSLNIKRPRDFSKKVMLIRPYPDMSYRNINLDNVSAVVHYLYHSSTACTEGDDTSVLEFADVCREKGVKLYMASFRERSMERLYLSSRKILEKDVIPLFSISAEAAYIKVLIAENTEIPDINKALYFENI